MEKLCSGLVAIMLLCNLSLSSAATGTATFYTPPYTPSSCYGYEDKGTMIAAASDEIWDNRAACGRNYVVQCTGATNQGGYPCNGNSVVVTIVDYCPPPRLPCHHRSLTRSLRRNCQHGCGKDPNLICTGVDRCRSLLESSSDMQ